MDIISTKSSFSKREIWSGRIVRGRKIYTDDDDDDDDDYDDEFFGILVMLFFFARTQRYLSKGSAKGLDHDDMKISVADS